MYRENSHWSGRKNTRQSVLYTRLPSRTIIGDAYVKEELTLKANCVMQGNIYTTKLEIESQAKFNGTCNTNDANHEIKLLEAVTE